MLRLDGRVAIVTGGSRGIGSAVAKRLAENGAELIIVGRTNESLLRDTAHGIEEQYGVNVHSICGDVGDPATAQKAVRLALSEFRRLDIVVNNAGILEDALIGMIKECDIDETLSTNVKGVINFTQACSRLMERSGGGSIVNVSSIIGRFGNHGQLVYGASKAAVIGATLSSAKELAPKNIRVNAVAPGYIATDMIKNIDESIDRQRRASIGIGRIGVPLDVANAVLFLSSDMATYITGQTLGIDGGMLV